MRENAAGNNPARSNKPELVFAWEYLEWGGVQTLFLDIMREAVRRGYPVTAVMPRGTTQNLIDYFHDASVKTEFFDQKVDFSTATNIWHKVRRRLRDARAHLALARYLTARGFDNQIIQIDAPPWSAFWLFYYLTKRAPVFLMMHIATPFDPKSLNDHATKLKYQILCASPNFHLITSNQDMKNSLRDFVPPDYWEQIPVAMSGINLGDIRNALSADFDRAAILRKFDLPDGKIFVSSLGNVIERKGYRVLIEAAKLLKHRADIFFIWMGDGEKRGEMNRLIAESGLENNFKNITPSEFGKTRAELLELLRLADIYAHPAFAEGLPSAVIEAMGMGKPPVASRINAIPECVVDHENGFLIEAGDAAGFAAKIEVLADDKIRREQFGAAAQARVFREFTAENFAGVTIDSYEKYWQD